MVNSSKMKISYIVIVSHSDISQAVTIFLSKSSSSREKKTNNSCLVSGTVADVYKCVPCDHVSFYVRAKTAQTVSNMVHL